MRRFLVTASHLAIAGACLCSGTAWAQTSGPSAEGRDVVVIQDRLPTDPGAYSLVTSETIKTIGANHPAEILNTVPGVNVQMNSGQELLVAIRSPVLPAGAGQGSFLILENGIPIRAPGFGNVNALFELHHETADEIEVVRGPGSVRYGTNAVHGLINVIDPEPGAQTGSTLNVSYNSLQRARADATTNLDIGGTKVWAALSGTDDKGWRDSSSVGLQKLTLRTLNRGENWKAVATLSAVNLNQETAGFALGYKAYRDDDFRTINPNPEAYRDAWAARANVRFETNIGSDLLTIAPFAITQRMIFIQHFLPDQSTEKNGHDSYGLITRYDFGPEAMRWSVGADVQYADGFLKEIQTVPSFGGTALNRTFRQGIHYDYDVAAWTAGGYVELDWDFAKDWSLLAGVRAEINSYDYTTHKAPGTFGRVRVAPSREDNFNLLTPKLGLVYSGFEFGQLYANYARGERAPQTSDQYRLQNLQTLDKLKVEQLDSYEIGARGKLAGVTYDIAAYTMQKQNFFFRDSDGLNVPNGKTNHKGIEAALSGGLGQAFGGDLSWNANASWSNQEYAFNRNVVAASEDIVDGNEIDTAPEWLGDAGVTWANDTFSLGASLEYVGKYFTDAANLHTYPGHIVGHVRGSWKVDNGLEAYFIVRNAGDLNYADRGDFATNQDRYFPAEPANLTVGVRLRR